MPRSAWRCGWNLGLHNPRAAAIGKEGDWELSLAKQLLEALPEGSLLLAGRLYGVGAFLRWLAASFAPCSAHFLVRVRRTWKPKLLERLSDGSVLVEVKSSEGQAKLQAREIRGRVRRPRGAWVEVRFWTGRLDCTAYPAVELRALYARRWEQELRYKPKNGDGMNPRFHRWQGWKSLS